MPLTDLIRRFDSADDPGGSMPYLDDARAAPWLMGLRLEQGGEPLAEGRHDGIAIEPIGIDSGRDFALARAAGVKVGQGHLFGEPQCDRQAKHSSHGVAYNSLSPTGART